MLEVWVAVEMEGEHKNERGKVGDSERDTADNGRVQAGHKAAAAYLECLAGNLKKVAGDWQWLQEGGGLDEMLAVDLGGSVYWLRVR